MALKKNQMYFASDPDAKHDEHIVDYQLDNIDLKFNTDAGVFSKLRVDYGTGVLLMALQNVTIPDGNILDVGTGYGPLGLFAAKLWPSRQVEMIDVNKRGLLLAQRNAALNQVDNVVIYQSDVYEQVDKTKKFGLILTNPPIRAGKQVVSKILAGAKNYLVDNGKILVVIQKKQGEPSARKLLKATFGNCTILMRNKGYYILQAVKN